MTKRFIISEREKNSILNQHNSKKNFFIDDMLLSKLIIREQYDTKKLDDLKAEILSGLNNLKANNPMFSGKIDGYMKSLEGIKTNLICNGNKLSPEIQTKLNDAKEDLKLKQFLKDPENKIDGMVSKISFIENFCSTITASPVVGVGTQPSTDLNTQLSNTTPLGSQLSTSNQTQNNERWRSFLNTNKITAIQARMNDECPKEILNATLEKHPKARTGTSPNFKLKEDGKNGAGTQACYSVCNGKWLVGGINGVAPVVSQLNLPPSAPKIGEPINVNDIATLTSS
jgi:hypothetical protein